MRERERGRKKINFISNHDRKRNIILRKGKDKSGGNKKKQIQNIKALPYIPN